MKPIIISVATPPDGHREDAYPGWLVPDTDNLFAVDQREEADITAIPPHPALWFITHLPTGMAIPRTTYTRASSLADAVDIATRFYLECKSRGWDLHSTDALALGAAYKTLSREEALNFWEKVAGWPEKTESTATQQEGAG